MSDGKSIELNPDFVAKLLLIKTLFYTISVLLTCIMYQFVTAETTCWAVPRNDSIATEIASVWMITIGFFFAEFKRVLFAHKVE